MVKKAILIHGLGSSSDKTSLRNLEEKLRAKGYDVEYVDYNTYNFDLDKQRDEIRNQIEYYSQDMLSGDELLVIGHSLGGLHASKLSEEMSTNNNHFITINSPFSTTRDNVTDFKNVFDIFNLITEPGSLIETIRSGRMGLGGHAVNEEQLDGL